MGICFSQHEVYAQLVICNRELKLVPMRFVIFSQTLNKHMLQF